MARKKIREMRARIAKRVQKLYARIREGVRCVNCAGCGKEITAEEIAGHIKGRPYCNGCLEPK
jgi:23S rRNA pseudoU1915 N3-methylase RlmH